MSIYTSSVIVIIFSCPNSVTITDKDRIDQQLTQCHVYIMFSDEAKVTDVFLKLDVDFDRNVLDGSVTLTVEKVKPEATHVVS